MLVKTNVDISIDQNLACLQAVDAVSPRNTIRRHIGRALDRSGPRDKTTGWGVGRATSVDPQPGPDLAARIQDGDLITNSVFFDHPTACVQAKEGML